MIKEAVSSLRRGEDPDGERAIERAMLVEGAYANASLLKKNDIQPVSRREAQISRSFWHFLGSLSINVG